jgi:hypothetical protein
VKIKGCADLALDCFKKRTKIGQVNSDIIRLHPKYDFSNDDLLTPEYACALGLLLSNQEEAGYKEERLIKGGIFSKIKTLSTKF